MRLGFFGGAAPGRYGALAEASHPYKQNWQVETCLSEGFKVPALLKLLCRRRDYEQIITFLLFSALDQEAWGKMRQLFLDLFLSIKVLYFLVQFSVGLLPGNLRWTKYYIKPPMKSAAIEVSGMQPTNLTCCGQNRALKTRNDGKP